MGDPNDLPKIFANRLIRQVVDSSLGPDFETGPNDYLVMRTAFRSLGGEWVRVSLGDPKQVELIKQVVSTWGQQPERQAKSKVLV